MLLLYLNAQIFEGEYQICRIVHPFRRGMERGAAKSVDARAKYVLL